MKLPFNITPFIIGMIHLKPLPGSPRFAGMDGVISSALYDMQELQEGGVDGLMVENLGDAPYYKDPSSNPLTVSYMSSVICRLKERSRLPIGVNLLRNGCSGALAIASAFDLGYIRVNVLTEAYVTDQGIIEGCAADLLRLRAQIGSKVIILADVHVKHAYPLFNRGIEEAIADATERGMADAVVISGERTGKPPDVSVIKRVRDEFPHLQIIIGSGLTPQNVEMLRYVDGAIVGTYFKEGGNIEAPVSRGRVKELLRAARGIR